MLNSIVKKLVRITVAVCVLMSIMCGCAYRSYYGKRPCDQPGSIWSSVDGVITFRVDENGSCDGEMLIDGAYTDIHIANGPSVEFVIYQALLDENAVYSNPLEEWVGNFAHDDSFTVEVITSTYYEVGSMIEFVRISDE